VCAIEIGRIIAPDPSPMPPRSAEAHSGGGGGVFAFCDRIPGAWGPGGSFLFVSCVALSLRGLKEQDIRGWSKTTRVFSYLLCLWREWGCVAA